MFTWQNHIFTQMDIFKRNTSCFNKFDTLLNKDEAGLIQECWKKNCKRIQFCMTQVWIKAIRKQQKYQHLLSSFLLSNDGSV